MPLVPFLGLGTHGIVMSTSHSSVMSTSPPPTHRVPPSSSFSSSLSCVLYSAPFFFFNTHRRYPQPLSRKVCKRRNRNIRILRARFSALIPRDILNSVQNLVPPNEHQAKAVEARQEIDLRLGSAFTRFQTMRLQVSQPAYWAAGWLGATGRGCCTRRKRDEIGRARTG